MPLITLTTDFGLADSFVGAMKGVILSLCPAAEIIDISHQIPPQDIVTAAMILEEACPYFPDGTIHLAVVDPGVGGLRAAVAIRASRYFFIGPDNGIFDLALEPEKHAAEAVQLTNHAHQAERVSPTFHGRDIFAVTAARLANGVNLKDFGSPVEHLAGLKLPQPLFCADSIDCHALRADRFGNLITDLRLADYRRWNPGGSDVEIHAGAQKLHGLHNSFCDVPQGAALAYFGSSDRLEIAVNCSSARDVFGVAPSIRLTKHAS